MPVLYDQIPQVLVLETESIQTFEALFAAILNRVRPRDRVEFALVEEITAAVWRIRRYHDSGISHDLLEVYHGAVKNLILLRELDDLPNEPNPISGRLARRSRRETKNCQTNLIPFPDSPATNDAR